jgi:hypothetical protein
MSMTTLTKKISKQKQSPSPAVAGVIGAHRRVVKRLADVQHYLGGICAGMYLPGRGQNFINPVRPLSAASRPVFVTLEVTPELEFRFSGAIARRRRDKMVWAPIFSYDALAPMAASGIGRGVPAANIVLARRCVELLTELAGYGRRVSFNMAEALEPACFPSVVREPNGFITGEDYSAVLGLRVDNPAFSLAGNDIQVNLPNPAEKILTRMGVEFPLGMPSHDLEEAVASLRADIPEGISLSWSDAVEALLFRRPYISVAVPYAAALQMVPDQVVASLRKQLPAGIKMEATYSDIHAAALDPAAELSLSRLSRIQLFDSESLADMPDDYAGNVLPAPEAVSL